MLDERPRRLAMLRDSLHSYATILKNSGVPAEEAVMMVKAFAGKEIAQSDRAWELGMRSVLDAYFPD